MDDVCRKRRMPLVNLLAGTIVIAVCREEGHQWNIVHNLMGTNVRIGGCVRGDWWGARAQTTTWKWASLSLKKFETERRTVHLTLALRPQLNAFQHEDQVVGWKTSWSNPRPHNDEGLGWPLWTSKSEDFWWFRPSPKHLASLGFSCRSLSHIFSCYHVLL